MSKKTRKKGLRHQDRAKAALSKKGNGGHRQKWDGTTGVGKTHKLTGPPKDNRKKSRRMF